MAWFLQLCGQTGSGNLLPTKVNPDNSETRDPQGLTIGNKEFTVVGGEHTGGVWDTRLLIVTQRSIQPVFGDGC